MANPYLHVLRTPHALPMVLAAFIGRLPLSMVGWAACCWCRDRVLRPRRGGRRGRRGRPRRSPAPSSAGSPTPTPSAGCCWVLAVFVVSGALFLTSVRDDWPLWSVFLTAGAAGASLPPVSSMIRVRWTHLLRGTRGCPPRWPWSPWSTSSSSSSGRCWSPSCPRPGTPPPAWSPPSRWPPSAACCSPPSAAPSRRPAPREHRRGPSAMRVPGLRVLFVVGAAIGAVLGTLEISLVAFADEVGARSLSGVLIAGLAAWVDGRRHRLGHRALAAAAAPPAGRGARRADGAHRAAHPGARASG